MMVTFPGQKEKNEPGVGANGKEFEDNLKHQQDPEQQRA
jgi:hypothetical protein